MKEFWEKIKQFFKDKINIGIVASLVLFIVMVSIPVGVEIYYRICMGVLAVAVFFIAYKFYQKHVNMQNIYDNIDSITPEKKKNMFSTISSKLEKSERNNNLMFAIVFGIVGVLILFYILFK